jgi:hypothetical protein
MNYYRNECMNHARSERWSCSETRQPLVDGIPGEPGNRMETQLPHDLGSMMILSQGLDTNFHFFWIAHSPQ